MLILVTRDFQLIVDIAVSLHILVTLERRLIVDIPVKVGIVDIRVTQDTLVILAIVE